jgi:hypothetical protein
LLSPRLPFPQAGLFSFDCVFASPMSAMIREGQRHRDGGVPAPKW